MPSDRKHRTPTLHDVAQEAHTSVSSVSNYLNGYQFMRPELRERIRQAIDALGYTPNTTARNLRSGRTGQILLSVPDLRQNYFAQLASGIIDAAKPHGYNVIVRSCNNQRDEELNSIAIMGTNRADGLILSSVALTDADRTLLEGDYPLVVIGSRMADAPAPHVVVDNVHGAYQATSHLIENGCRSVAIIGAPWSKEEQSSFAERYHGYRAALDDHGIAFDPKLAVPAGWSRPGNGAQAIDDMLRRLDQPPQGIVVFNDTTAWGVIARLHSLGFSVPDDVRVTGFDDLPESAYFSPTLTSVDPDLDDICRTAVESVLRQIDDGRRSAPERIVIPATLRIRESSGDSTAR